MKSCNVLSLVVLGFFSFALLALSQNSDAAEDDTRKLQGMWQVVKFIDHSEQPAPLDELKDFTFEFKGGKIIQRKGKDRPGRPGTYTIDVSKKPKWMDINFGMVSEGIYKLEGDELSLCFVGGMRGGKATPRPTEFKASKNPPHSLFVLKRAKS